jgi:hypothetical protein
MEEVVGSIQFGVTRNGPFTAWRKWFERQQEPTLSLPSSACDVVYQVALPYAVVAIIIAVEYRVVLSVLCASAGTQIPFRMIIRQDAARSDVRLCQHDLPDFLGREYLTFASGLEYRPESVTIRRVLTSRLPVIPARVGTNRGTETENHGSNRALLLPRCSLTL